MLIVALSVIALVMLCALIYIAGVRLPVSDRANRGIAIGLAGAVVTTIFSVLVSYLVSTSNAPVKPPATRSAHNFGGCMEPDLRQLGGPAGGIREINPAVADVDDDGIDEVAVVVAEETSSTVHLMDCRSDKWAELPLVDQVSWPGCVPKPKVTHLRQPGKAEFLIQDTCGSGGYLTFALFGGEDGEISILAKDEAVFGGTLSLTSNQIVVQNSESGWTYTWNEDKFERQSQGFLPQGATKVAQYWCSDDKITVTGTEIRLFVGERLTLTRDEARMTASGGGSPRLLSYGDEVVEWATGAGDTLTAKAPGFATIYIECRAYAGPSTEITIEVLE